MDYVCTEISLLLVWLKIKHPLLIRLAKKVLKTVFKLLSIFDHLNMIYNWVNYQTHR